MQFITHRDPLAQSGLATALGATGDIAQNLLSIYGNYKTQQQHQKQQDIENKLKQDELALQHDRENRAAGQMDLQNQLAARKYQEDTLTQGLDGTRKQVKTGERTVDAAPDFSVDSKKPDAATPFGAFKLDTSLAPHAAPAQPFKLDLAQPTRTEDVMGAAPVERQTMGAITDPNTGRVLVPERTMDVRYRDEVEADNRRKLMDNEVASGRMMRLSPEQRATIAEQAKTHPGLGIWANSDVIPTAIADDLIRTANTVPKPPDPFETVKPVSGGYLTADGKGNVVFHRTEQDKAAGKGEGGKPLLATEVSKIHDFRSGLGQLSNLLDEAQGTGTAAWALTKTPSWVGQAFGWGNDAKSRQAALDTAKQIIGKAMEGGVLRKEDEIKYKRILPVITDPPDVARNKIKNIVDTMIRDSSLYIEELEAAGRDVSGVSGLVQRSGNEARLAIGGVPTNGAGADPAVEARRNALLTPEERRLGAPGARAQGNAFGLPRVRVDHNSVRR